MVTILQLEVSKRRLFEKVSVERCWTACINGHWQNIVAGLLPCHEATSRTGGEGTVGIVIVG